jgi:hypothetical protein
VRNPPGHRGHGPLKCVDEADSDGSGRWAGADRSRLTPGGDETEAALDEPLVALFHLAPDGWSCPENSSLSTIATRHVATAEDRVAARQVSRAPPDPPPGSTSRPTSCIQVSMTHSLPPGSGPACP